MSKIKINFFMNGFGIGGSEKTALLFASNLSSDFECQIFTYQDSAMDRLNEFRSCGVVDFVNRHAPEWNKLEDCDILHTFRSGYVEAPEPGYHVNVKHFIETNIFGFYDNNPKISRSLFMSKWLMDNTIGKLGMKPNRFDFVNNPVEMPYTNDELEIAKRWKADGAIVVGRCGRPDNGIYNAVSVDAVHLLRMQGHDIRFLVVAPPSNMIEDLARHDIPFHVITPTTSPLVLSTFYNSVDIYTHARADGETFGVNIAEAMIHGKPVITHIATPSVPGMGVFQSQTELVDSGKTGIVVNNTPGEYADALKQLIDDDDLRRTMGEFGRRKAEAEYEVSVCMHKLENIYREIVA